MAGVANLQAILLNRVYVRNILAAQRFVDYLLLLSVLFEFNGLSFSYLHKREVTQSLVFNPLSTLRIFFGI